MTTIAIRSGRDCGADRASLMAIETIDTHRLTTIPRATMLRIGGNMMAPNLRRAVASVTGVCRVSVLPGRELGQQEIAVIWQRVA